MPLPILGPALDFFANLLGLARKRQDLVNTPEMQAAARAKTDQQLKDQGAEIVAKQDIEAARKGISE